MSVPSSASMGRMTLHTDLTMMEEVFALEDAVDNLRAVRQHGLHGVGLQGRKIQALYRNRVTRAIARVWQCIQRLFHWQLAARNVARSTLALNRLREDALRVRMALGQEHQETVDPNSWERLLMMRRVEAAEEADAWSKASEGYFQRCTDQWLGYDDGLSQLNLPKTATKRLPTQRPDEVDTFAYLQRLQRQIRAGRMPVGHSIYKLGIKLGMRDSEPSSYTWGKGFVKRMAHVQKISEPSADLLVEFLRTLSMLDMGLDVNSDLKTDYYFSGLLQPTGGSAWLREQIRRLQQEDQTGAVAVAAAADRYLCKLEKGQDPIYLQL